MADSKKAVSGTKEEQLAVLLRWVDEFEDNTRDARRLSLQDRAYKNGKQWSSSEIADLDDAGLPRLTFNKIAPKVNGAVGDEIQSRVAPKAFARTEDHADDATVVVDVLRYLADKEDMDQHSTECTSEVMVEGAHAVVLVTPTIVGADGKKRVDVCLRRVPFSRLVWDPRSQCADFSDALYLGLQVWVGIEDAANDPRYRGRGLVIEESLARSGQDADEISGDKPRAWVSDDRRRIRVVELYWREWSDDGGIVWHGAQFTQGGFLVDPYEVSNEDDSDKRANYCPVIAVSGYIDDENNRFGFVRDLISPQDEINHRHSRMLNESGKRTLIYEEGAVLDINTALVELAKAGGAVRVEDGAMAEGRVKVVDRNDVVASQVQMEQIALSFIEQIGPGQSVSQAQSADSGRLFLAREQAGRRELGELGENIRKWKLRVYRVMWWAARQYMTAETVLRVRDDKEKKGYRFFEINVKRGTKGERVEELVEKGVGTEEAVTQVMGADGAEALRANIAAAGKLAEIDAQTTNQQVPAERIEAAALKAVLASSEAHEPFSMNDIAQLGADIVVETVADSVTVRNEQFQEFMRAAQGGAFQGIDPKILVETMLRLSEWTFAEDILEKIQPTDQQQQQQAQTAQQQQQVVTQQLQVQMAQAQAQIAKLQADAELRKAQTEKARADAALAAQRAAIGVPAEAAKDLSQAHTARVAGDVAMLRPQGQMAGGNGMMR